MGQRQSTVSGQREAARDGSRPGKYPSEGQWPIRGEGGGVLIHGNFLGALGGVFFDLGHTMDKFHVVRFLAEN